MLAMHMANELLTPSVAACFFVISAGVLVLASRRMGQRFDADKVPLMGVLGAFVFAAQMINFPVLLGVSGHLGGGVLLAILLGPHAATLVMASILIVQCLIFQDGGLLALGTNIFNMGVIPCYLGYLLFTRLAGDQPSGRRLYVAVFTATLVGMIAGAAMVPIQVSLSGVLLTTVSLSKFMSVMVGLHLLVGLGEAIITFLVVGYVVRVRPQALGSVAQRLARADGGLSKRALLGSLAVVALLLGGVVSHLASGAPDALESLTDPDESALVAPNANATVAEVSDFQERTAPLPDYQWTSFSGVVGTVATLLIVWAVGQVLRRRRDGAFDSLSTGGA